MDHDVPATQHALIRASLQHVLWTTRMVAKSARAPGFAAPLGPYPLLAADGA